MQICRCCVVACDVDLKQQSQQDSLNDYVLYHYNLISIINLLKPSRRMRWAGHVARMGEERGVYRLLVGKPGGKRPLGRPRRR